MVVELLQISTAETIAYDLTAQATLAVHPDADYAVFFIGVSATNIASDRSLIGILHRYNGSTVSVMKEADLLDQNERKYRFQIGRVNSPSTGNNTYEVQFDYTGAKTVLFSAVSYKGVDLTGSGLEEVATETNAEAPGISVTSTASGNLVVDALLYREVLPFDNFTVSGTSPIASGTQLVATVSGVFTIDNDDWGLVVSELLTTASGVVDMGWTGTTNPHVHFAGAVVAS